MTDGTEKCNPKIEENQREDRRAFRKFIVLLLAAMVVGGITGAFSTMARAMVTSCFCPADRLALSLITVS